MRAIRLFFACWVLGMLASPAMADGPFGIEMGKQPEEYGGKPIDDGYYDVPNPPRRHPDFVLYYVDSTPETGICRVTAGSRRIDNDAYGTRTRGLFREIVSQVEKTYGAPKITDRFYGTVPGSPSMWMWELKTRDRRLSARWRAADGAKLPGHITEILLAAYSNVVDQGALLLTYSLKNADACQKILDDAKAKAF